MDPSPRISDPGNTLGPGGFAEELDETHHLWYNLRHPEFIALPLAAVAVAPAPDASETETVAVFNESNLEGNKWYPAQCLEGGMELDVENRSRFDCKVRCLERFSCLGAEWTGTDTSNGRCAVISGLCIKLPGKIQYGLLPWLQARGYSTGTSQAR